MVRSFKQAHKLLDEHLLSRFVCAWGDADFSHEHRRRGWFPAVSRRCVCCCLLVCVNSHVHAMLVAAFWNTWVCSK